MLIRLRDSQTRFWLNRAHTIFQRVRLLQLVVGKDFSIGVATTVPATLLKFRIKLKTGFRMGKKMLLLPCRWRLTPEPVATFSTAWKDSSGIFTSDLDSATFLLFLFGIFFSFHLKSVFNPNKLTNLFRICMATFTLQQPGH